MRPIALGLVMLVGLTLVAVQSPAMAGDKQARILGEELSTIARQLSLRPESAIDLSDVSGAYCFDVGLGDGGHMTHYAIDPTSTKEDVIDFVNADQLIEAGLDVEALPRLPTELGAMEPNQWYFLPEGEYDPHHGRDFNFPLLVRASDLD